MISFKQHRKNIAEAAEPKTWEVSFSTKHKKVQVTAPTTASAYKKAEALAKKNEPGIASMAVANKIKKLVCSCK